MSVRSEMWSERDSPLKRLYRRTHAKLTRLAGFWQLVWAAGCELSLALVHARPPAWPGETSETILRVAPPRKPRPPDHTRVNWPVDASASGSAQVGSGGCHRWAARVQVGRKPARQKAREGYPSHYTSLVRWSIQIEKIGSAYIYIHIYHIYPIHITLVVPSRQCLFTYFGYVTIGLARHNRAHVNQSERLLVKPKRPCTDLCAEPVGVLNRLVQAKAGMSDSSSWEKLHWKKRVLTFPPVSAHIFIRNEDLYWYREHKRVKIADSIFRKQMWFWSYHCSSRW